MNTVPKLISVINNRPLPKYYVYYDEWTGDIITVSNKYKTSNHPYLVTEDSTAESILLGHLNPNKYIVNENAGGTFIIERTKSLRIKAEEDQLSKISEMPLATDREINLIRYINSWKLEININPSAVYKMTGSRFNRKFSKTQNQNNSSLFFYVTAKNNPLHLIKTIKIDPIDLINNGYYLYDLSNLKNVIGLNDIDILTRRVFKSYGLKTKQNYVSVEYIKRKNQTRNHFKILNSEDKAAFTISESTAGWVFKCNFETPEEFKIYADLTLYLTGNTPYEMYDKVHLPLSELGNYKEFYVKTNANFLASMILIGEEGKHLSFNYEEI